MVCTASIADLPEIVGIYNQAIVARFQTCFTEAVTVEDKFQWFNDHEESKYPLLVYKQDGKVLGWLSISPYRQGRNALRYAVEISYFLDNAYLGQGIGSLLLARALVLCRHMGYKTALAVLIDSNTASIKLLEKFGFIQWGYLPAIADFDGKECGQYYYGLKL